MDHSKLWFFLSPLITLAGCSETDVSWRSSSDPGVCNTASELCDTDLFETEEPVSEQAYRICFVGDGFGSSKDYHGLVDSYIRGLRENPAGFIALDPELFEFRRVELDSDETGTNNEERDDTALGAGLDYNAFACIRPLIDSWRANKARERCGDVDALVMIANGSIGRANTVGGFVYVSSTDDWRVVQHELGHALFGLADEYTEFVWCSERAPRNSYELLPTPNISLFDSQETPKWAYYVDGRKEGGGRWPCLVHPTDSCNMLSHSNEGFCPVCEAHIREALAGKRCAPDVHPPRLVFTEVPIWRVDIGEGIHLTVAAHDESPLGEYHYYVDDELVHVSRLPEVELSDVELVPGSHHAEVRVRDSAGNWGTTGSAHIFVFEGNRVPPELELVSTHVDPSGWLDLVVGSELLGGLIVVRWGEREFIAEIQETETELRIPLSLDGPHEFELFSEAPDGHRSKPERVSFRLPRSLYTLPPQITIARIGGLDLDLSSAAIGEVDLELRVETCSPLLSVELRTGRGTLLSIAEPIESGTCEYEMTLAIPAHLGPRAMEVAVTDGWKRVSTRSFSLEGLHPDTQCPAPVASNEIGSIVSPIAFTVPDGVAVSWFFRGPTQALPYNLVSSTEVSVFPVGKGLSELDNQESSITATVSQRCQERMIAQRFERTVTIDNRAPKIGLAPFGRPGSLMVLELEDGGTVRTFRATWPDGTVDIDSEPPFEIPIRSGLVDIRAEDEAGNVGQKFKRVYVFPEGTRTDCQEEMP